MNHSVKCYDEAKAISNALGDPRFGKQRVYSDLVAQDALRDTAPGYGDQRFGAELRDRHPEIDWADA